MLSCTGRYNSNAIDAIMFPRALAMVENLWDYYPDRYAGDEDLQRIEAFNCILRRNGILSGPLRSSDTCVWWG